MSCQSNHASNRKFAVLVQSKQTVAVEELDVGTVVIIHEICDDSDGNKLSVASIHQVNVANATVDGKGVECSVSCVVGQDCYLVVEHLKKRPALAGMVVTLELARCQAHAFFRLKLR